MVWFNAVKGFGFIRTEDDERLYVHSSAFEPAEWHYVTELYSAAKSLMATRAHATFCGHTHVPALFHMSMTGKFASFDPVERVEIPLTPQRRWLAVIGSVGQPRDRDPAACYAVLDDERDVLTYVRVPYDIASAAQKIRAARDTTEAAAIAADLVALTQRISDEGLEPAQTHMAAMLKAEGLLGAPR